MDKQLFYGVESDDPGVILLQIAEALFQDYMENIVDKAYHRLLTLDNVSKCRPEILGRLHDALCDKGVLYMSVRKGDFEGFRGERYFTDYTADSLISMISRTGLFEIIKTWETDDVRSSHPDTVWVNLLARKR